MIAIVPEELLVEKFRQDALWCKHRVVYRNLNFLSCTLPEADFISLFTDLILNLLLRLADGPNQIFGDEFAKHSFLLSLW